MAQGMNLLHYPCQRVMVEQFEQRGHEVVIRKNRNGDLRWRLDGRKTEINTLTAMERINIGLARPLHRFTVIFEVPANPGWQFFSCEAEDGDHAQEQCENAHPAGVVLWVNTGDDRTMEGQ